MSQTTVRAFPSEVVTKLKNYVYRLIDPRNGETFYVGRGRGNRLFAHIREEVEGDEVDNKLRRIRDIHLVNLEVGHVIHRHGLDDAVAIELEAALIDAYPGLSNRVGGQGSSDYGPAHATEILNRYKAEPAVFRHRVLLINVSHSASEQSLFEAVRYAWVISRRRAEEAEVVLAVINGLIVGAFVPDKWLDATVRNFPGRDPVPGRLGFEGHEAPPEIKALYLNKRVPDSMRKQGAANPIRYTWK